jgi:hypothetical protein
MHILSIIFVKVHIYSLTKVYFFPYDKLPLTYQPPLDQKKNEIRKTPKNVEGRSCADLVAYYEKLYENGIATYPLRYSISVSILSSFFFLLYPLFPLPYIEGSILYRLYLIDQNTFISIIFVFL